MNYYKFERNVFVLLGLTLSFIIILGSSVHKKPTVSPGFSKPDSSVPFVENNVNNQKVLCHDLQDADQCLDAFKNDNRKLDLVLWFGNSQLHAINSYKDGDKTAPVLLHGMLAQHKQYLMAFSQPNANLQEHYLLFAYLSSKLKIRQIIIPIFFDDMREDGIRSTLRTAILDKGTKGALVESSIGINLLKNNQHLLSPSKRASSDPISLQELTEKALNDLFEKYFIFWRERDNRKVDLVVLLQKIRNSLFNINPSSVRKKIPGRYDKNQQAFKALLELANAKGIKVLSYLPPLRNDVPIPYDFSEYESFKSDFELVAAEYKQQLIDLESVVPNHVWGYKESTNLTGNPELDFMHFKSVGHELLAERLFYFLIGR